MEELNRAPTAMAFGSKLSLRTPVWLLGILTGAAVVFVGGFYFPQKEASSVLTQHLENLSKEYQASVAAYEKTNAELSAVEKVRDEQKGKLGAISEAKSKAAEALDALHREIEAGLEKPIKNKLVLVEKRSDSVAIILQALYLVYPHKTFVHDQGKRLLCEIGKSIPEKTGRATEIVAHANGDVPWSGLIKKQLPTSVQLSATIASEVTLELTNCGVAGKNLRAVGAGHFEGDPKLARKSPARMEILVYPESSP